MDSKKTETYKAIVLNDYLGKHYATWVMQGKKTIETRDKLFRYTGDIIICCGSKSTTINACKALCIVHFGKGRPMMPEDSDGACFPYSPDKIVYDLTNKREFNRRFTFAKQYVAGSFQSIFDITLPNDVRIIKPLPIINSQSPAQIKQPFMEYVQVKTLEELNVGDIIKGKSSGIAYFVVGNYGSHVTAVRTQDVTNPSEWQVLRPTPNP